MPTPIKLQALLRLPSSKTTLLQIFLLFISPALIYGQFLWNPVVFDDIYFFDGKVHDQYLGKIFSLDLRWLPYATFEWTRALFGLELNWFHLGNLALHVANTIALFLLLQRLFNVVLPAGNTIDGRLGPTSALAPSWLAFFGALIFALHPAAVYAVAYLSQRSTLMATFFTLVMWRLFLEGSIRESRWLIMASAAAYFFAVFSKEHAIMAPALSCAMLLLLRQPFRQLLRQAWPVFVLYGLIGAFVIFQRQSNHILGQAYEINAVDMLARLARVDPGFDRSLAYPLSILTQSFLFFKYLLLWIVPAPYWMSVDMVENFASRLWSWPELAGLAGFIVYPFVALHLLRQRGIKGLFGFALLCPWILFFTEFSTVRIQESFVLYRSYLWMAGFLAAMPFLVQKLSAKHAAMILTAVVLVMVPTTWTRLSTFSHPLLLWDDAARLVEQKGNRPGLERIYYNRGNAFFDLKLNQEAIADFSKAIAVYPEYSYAYLNRGVVYLQTGKYTQSMSDLTRAIELNPQDVRPYLGRGMVYEALNNFDAARRDYEVICSSGIERGCQKLREVSRPH